MQETPGQTPDAGQEPVAEATPAPTPTTAPPSATLPPVSAPTSSPHRSGKKFWILIGLVAALIAGGLLVWLYSHNHPKAATTATTTHIAKKATTAPEPSVPGQQLDTAKNYGNKYADGILPVGDGKYVSDAPKTGYVYACANYARNIAQDNGGAGKRGPWFTNNNTEYDLNKKLHVIGNVMWKADFSNTVNGTTRTITTNDLPTHPTGIFPIQASDPAYAYDRNPNTISGQTLTYSLPANPTYNTTPNCMGGESGVMLTGIALFNALDAGGRDAGAWEVQDSCDGHPQSEGEYHYHTLSSCIKDVSVHTVIGYALDGFPITGPQVSSNNVLTTSDLDECHGIVSSIGLDGGKTATMYHYVMTQDFPYSVSCFRGTAIMPPGQQVRRP